MKLPLSCIIPILGLTLAIPAFAQETDTPQHVSFRGFGSLGAVHTRGDGAVFLRDSSQPDGAGNRGLTWKTDSRIGVQANARVSESVEAVAQIISRYRYENNFQPELNWGFIKYTPSDNLSLRAGRVGFDVFLAADSRDVGYSYLWVRPPVEYYGTLSVPYIDGGDVTLRLPLAGGRSRFKLYSGLARQKLPFHQKQTEWVGGKTLIGGIPMSGTTLDLSGSRITGGFVDWQDDHWIARLGKANFRLAAELIGPIDPKTILHNAAVSANASGNSMLAQALYAFVDDFSPPGKRISFESLGVAYDKGPLQAQFAINHFTSKSLVYPESHAAYLSVGYRLGKFVPYGVVSAVRSKQNPRAETLASLGTPAPIANLARFMLSADMVTQHTYSLGMRYDFRDNMALKLQLDRIRNGNCAPASLPIVGTSPPCSPPILWASVPAPWNGRANVLSAILDFTY